MTSTNKIEEMELELAKLKLENESLKSNANKPLIFKVSTKKAISIYGMRRFPITLYRQEWERILERANDLKSFIADNADLLVSYK